MTLQAEYQAKVALLSGEAFEDEVVRALTATFGGFQRVPAKPQGDGGLDGLSHKRTRAYCCYGPETQPGPGTLPGALRQKIVKKFKSDLRRLLELTIKNKTNTSIEGVLGKSPSAKITVVTLICNVFEDKRLIGDLNDAFDLYLKASSGRFVDANCALVFWGPKDLANNTVVTMQSLARLDDPGLLAAWQTVAVQSKAHEPTNPEKFNEKFDALLALEPDQKDEIETLKATFKEAWSKSILLNQLLADTLPSIHEEFEHVRKASATQARISSGKAGADPFGLLQEVQNQLKDRVGRLLNGGLPPKTQDELIEAEAGRLIGECPLRWKKAQ